jgi:hypothetical protein
MRSRGSLLEEAQSRHRIGCSDISNGLPVLLSRPQNRGAVSRRARLHLDVRIADQLVALALGEPLDRLPLRVGRSGRTSVQNDYPGSAEPYKT